MDFQFSPDEESFRQEIRSFLKTELPREHEVAEVGMEDPAFARRFVKTLAEKRWVAAAWPKEYGGLGLSVWEQLIFNEEMAYHRAPLTSTSFGVGWAGPTVILYGTDEQKRRHLPAIAQGDAVWCQGFSEPNAGSDLASLRTLAVRDGDDYVINGQKIWTSGAHEADWMILLARTDQEAPKHKGISYFLVDMKTHGISVQPIVSMMGTHRFNEVFFENARVPRNCLVGEENRGWYVATATLDFERSSIAKAAEASRLLEDVVDYLRDARIGDGTLGNTVGNAVANAALEIQIGRLLSYKVASLQAKGEAISFEAATAKVFNTEMYFRLAATGLSALGSYGQLKPESKWARLGGRLERQYLWQIGMMIAGGTSEIQKNIVARRGLGLPS
jgi:alkylation response protein AidB-like acyl-CoA dehydrogenase